MKKVIIDCDPGIDDALALIFAVKSNLLEIEGITTVMGNSTVQNTTRNALKILDLLDNNNIPVYMGAQNPLKGKYFGGEEVHGEGGLAGIDSESPRNRQEIKDANAFLAEYLQEYPRSTEIISLGPLTNIANLIISYPEVVPNVKELTIMGGAIEVPGNITPDAEFNIYCDPRAAEIVFNSSIKNITLVPLDVTKKVVLTPKMLDTLKSSSIQNEKLKELIIKSLEFYQNYCIKKSNMYGCPLHDPLAVGRVINGSFLKEKSFELKVTEKEISIKSENGKIVNFTMGKIIRKDQFPNFFSKKRQKVKVCLKVNENRFLKYFINTIQEK
jgi:purine nucleosidase